MASAAAFKNPPLAKATFSAGEIYTLASVLVDPALYHVDAFTSTAEREPAIAAMKSRTNSRSWHEFGQRVSFFTAESGRVITNGTSGIRRGLYVFPGELHAYVGALAALGHAATMRGKLSQASGATANSRDTPIDLLDNLGIFTSRARSGRPCFGALAAASVPDAVADALRVIEAHPWDLLDPILRAHIPLDLLRPVHLARQVRDFMSGASKRLLVSSGLAGFHVLTAIAEQLQLKLVNTEVVEERATDESRVACESVYSCFRWPKAASSTVKRWVMRRCSCSCAIR